MLFDAIVCHVAKYVNKKNIIYNLVMIKNYLSKIMGEKRMKPAELQKLTGLSKDTIYKLYYDKKQTIKLDTLNRLCKALDCNTQELFEYIPD